MKPNRLSHLICALLLSIALTAPAVPARADALIEDFWNYAYGVDYDVYINSSDGVGLNVRYGPGTNYDLTGVPPIPDGTKVHIEMECVSDYGNKWGLVSQEIGGDYVSGWIYLPETSDDPPASKSTPEPTAEPTPIPTVEPTPELPPESTDAPIQNFLDRFFQRPESDPDASQTPAATRTPRPAPSEPLEQRPEGIYISTDVAAIGIVVLVIALTAAILLIVMRKKNKKS